ncbi:MAG: formate--tetrahydrofolate ligase [Bacilli bacterium]
MKDSDYDIKKIAEKLGIPEDDLVYYGRDKAKIETQGFAKDLKRKAKLILCTAITPTKAGEGKTTTAIGLADGLALKGEKALVCLREPSLGPVFGVKGGGCGGGEETLHPEDDINLHFTGDIHALTSSNNLIAALIDNELFQNSDLRVDPERVIFPRAMDMNDRSLREIETCLQAKTGPKHRSSFVITAASEIMAIFCLSKDEDDFLNRVEEMTVAYDLDGKAIKVKALECRAAIHKLMKDALLPNLVQTKYHTPAIVHGGPFANIAHGCNSLIASDLSLKLADYVVTEAGFGSDLGMEKFLDIACPLGDFKPNLIVMVATVRALKLHGGVKFEDLHNSDPDAVRIGLANLGKHLSNVSLYHVPVLASINRFKDDSDEEIEVVEDYLDSISIPYALNTSYIDGPKGALELAAKAKEMADSNNGEDYRPLVDSNMSIKEKIETICTKIYGASGVEYSDEVNAKIDEFEKEGLSSFSVCISKTPNSLSDDPHLLNVPEHTIHVKGLRLFTGAHFIVPLTGSIVTMPGLPKVPASKKMKL